MCNFKYVDLNELISKDKIKYGNSYLKNAKLLEKNIFLFQHVYDMEPSPIEYHLDNWQISPNGDPEWLYVLNRQEYLQDLLYSYLKTQKTIYLKKIKFFILEWIYNNEKEERSDFNKWRTIDTGIRLLNWTKPLSLLIKEKILSNEDIFKIRKSVKRQSNYLYQYYIEKYDLSNWGVLITTGILTFDAEHPNIIKKEITDWALSKFELELKLQIDNMGMHWEQSPLYFIEVLRNSLCVIASEKSNNKYVSANILSVLKRMLVFSYYLVKPDGKIVQQGDTDSIPIDDLIASAKLLLYGITSKEDYYDFLLMSLANKAKIKTEDLKLTEKDSFDDYSSGNFYYKNVGQKSYWHVYNGDIGSGHGHASFGHIDLFLNNENILIDPGRYTYVNSYNRRYLKSGFSHNVVLIDKFFPIIPLDSWSYKKFVSNQNNEVQHFDLFDSVKSCYMDTYNKSIITRYFIWLKQFEIMVIIDVVQQLGSHIQTTNWILNPEARVKLIYKGANVFINKNQYKFFCSSNNIKLKKQIFSARYNELKNTFKLITSSCFTNSNISYTVIGKADLISTVKHITSYRDGSKDNNDIRNYGIVVYLKDSKEITINIQHEKAMKGNRLYIVNNIPFYGNISVEY